MVLWGDHGHFISENTDSGESNTLFEVFCPFTADSQRTSDKPSLILKPDALVELIDIYPTLCDACQLPTPTELEGISMIRRSLSSRHGHGKLQRF